MGRTPRPATIRSMVPAAAYPPSTTTAFRTICRQANPGAPDRMMRSIIRVERDSDALAPRKYDAGTLAAAAEPATLPMPNGLEPLRGKLSQQRLQVSAASIAIHDRHARPYAGHSRLTRRRWKAVARRGVARISRARVRLSGRRPRGSGCDEEDHHQGTKRKGFLLRDFHVSAVSRNAIARWAPKDPGSPRPRPRRGFRRLA